MMHTRPISSDQDQSSVLIRALRSLRAGDVEIVGRLVNAFGSGWSVQTCDDYDGYLLMLIEPSAEHAEKWPSYVVSGKTGQIELAAVNGDSCQTIDRFDDIYGLVAELTVRLLGTALQSDINAA